MAWKNLIGVWLSAVVVLLLMIQVDSLSGYQPRFSVWAGEYITNTETIKHWKETWTLVRSKDVSSDPVMQYNYATMLAQQWEKVWLPEGVQDRKQAIEKYTILLEEQNNEFAQYNKTLLEQLLEQQPQEQEEPQSWEDQEQEGQSWDPEQSQEWEEWSQDSEQDSPSDSSEGESEWGEAPSQSWLSEEQIQEFKDYQEQLQQQQFQNQQHFGKQPQDQQPQSIFDQFFGDPQFKQGAWGDEKDW